MATKYQGTGYPNGFNPNVKKPMDVRTVVDTIADRNLLEFTYPGMEVTVLGSKLVVNGIDTYPQAAVYKLLVEKQSVFGGPTTVDADWKRLDVPPTVGGAGYKGAWDASTNTPNLKDPALLATLKPGDFYKVSIPGNTTLNGISGWQQNDSAFWDGSVFGKFQNTNPAAVQPLYADTDGARFQTDVLALIRLNALTEHRPGRGFEINTYVKSTYAVDGKTHVDTYVATQTMGPNAAALPTPTSPNPNWQLISTTNGAKLGGTAQGNDARGRAASGAFMPATRTPNEYLSPEEVDARIKQYGGKSTGPLLGGNAATFLTADTAETPRN